MAGTLHERDLFRRFVRTIIVESTKKRAACIYVENEDGLILSVSRKDDASQLGLPGGKVDGNGETPYQAAKRELREETGLSASRLKLVFVASDGEYETYTFIANVSGKISTKESGALKWVTKEQLLDPEFSPFHEYNARLFVELEKLYSQ